MAPIVVGAIVVGFGTSAPEMLVSSLAAVNGRLDIGVGNIIGSNVANISLVLGAASFVAVVPVSSGVIRRDAAVSVAAVAIFALLVQGELGRLEGLVMLAALGAWFVLILRGARTRDGEAEMGDLSEIVGEDPPPSGSRRCAPSCRSRWLQARLTCSWRAPNGWPRRSTCRAASWATPWSPWERLRPSWSLRWLRPASERRSSWSATC